MSQGRCYWHHTVVHKNVWLYTEICPFPVVEVWVRRSDGTHLALARVGYCAAHSFHGPERAATLERFRFRVDLHRAFVLRTYVVSPVSPVPSVTPG